MHILIPVHFFQENYISISIYIISNIAVIVIYRDYNAVAKMVD